MNRLPIEGDVLKVGRKELVVVESRAIHEQAYDGTYHGWYFDTIDRAKLGTPNPKTRPFFINNMSMGRGNAEGVTVAELTFVEQLKLKKSVVTTYSE